MHYRVGALDYGVSLGAFFQINRTLIGELVTVATSNSRGRLAWDLYAGVGLFSKVLATRFGRVVAVEGAPISCADLRANLSPGHQAVQSSTLDFLRREAARLRRGSVESTTAGFCAGRSTTRRARRRSGPATRPNRSTRHYLRFLRSGDTLA